MRSRILLAVVASAVLALVLTGAPSSDPYAPSKKDPYLVEVKTVPDAQPGRFFVHVTVTEKATGTVVFSPKVSTTSRTPAEMFSEKDGKSFEVRVTLTEDGRATAIFRAYEKVLQRSVVNS